MTTPFLLNPGESKTVENEGMQYKISCSLSKDHDHENKPLYHYHEGINDDDLIATVESNDAPPYPSPYSSEVKDQWGIMREKVFIHFLKKDDGLWVEIEEIEG